MIDKYEAELKELDNQLSELYAKKQDVHHKIKVEMVQHIIESGILLDLEWELYKLSQYLEYDNGYVLQASCDSDLINQTQWSHRYGFNDDLDITFHSGSVCLGGRLDAMLEYIQNNHLKVTAKFFDDRTEELQSALAVCSRIKEALSNS